MALITDFTTSPNIVGATEWVLTEKMNGQSIYDASIGYSTVNASIPASAVDGTICVSGTLCDITDNNGIREILLPDAENKGKDVEYILADLQFSWNKLYDNDHVGYNYGKKENSLNLVKLVAGQKFYLKVVDDVLIGDKMVVNYSGNLEYALQKAVANDYACFEVLERAQAGQCAEVICIGKTLIV